MAHGPLVLVFSSPVSYCDPRVRRVSSVINNLLTSHLLINRWMDFEIISQECSLGDPLSWTKWPPELKNRKTFKQYLLLGQWPDFKIISQKCFLGDPLPNLQNGSAPLNKMAAKAKNRKTFKRNLLLGQWADFKIISQKCSLGDRLPKLLKWFHSTENGSLSYLSSGERSRLSWPSGFFLKQQSFLTYQVYCIAHCESHS